MFLASLSPVRLADEVTDRLGALLISLWETLLAVVKEAAKLPAGLQVAIALMTVAFLGFCVVFMLRAFRDAAGIMSRFRKASAESSKARKDLAERDRQRALGYLLLLSAVIGLLVLAAFVYHSWQGPEPPKAFQGR